jgi:hypothetical protein
MCRRRLYDIVASRDAFLSGNEYVHVPYLSLLLVGFVDGEVRSGVAVAIIVMVVVVAFIAAAASTEREVTVVGDHAAYVAVVFGIAIIVPS